MQGKERDVMGSSDVVAVSADVIVVGAGVVGCAAALMVRAALPELKVIVLEQDECSVAVDARAQMTFNERLWSDAWRVSALGLSSRAVFESLGLWAAIGQSGLTPFRDMCLRDAEGTGCLRLSAQDAGEAVLGYVVENENLLGHLRQACLLDAGIDVRFGQKLATLVCGRAGAPCALYCSDAADEALPPKIQTIYQAPLVVSAEGRQSVIRNQLALPEIRRDYRQKALVCQVEMTHPHQWVAWQDFLDTGPVAFLPLSARTGFDPVQEVPWPCAGESERFCSIVWSLDCVQAQAILNLEAKARAEAMVLRLSAIAPPELGKVERCSPVLSFPLSGFLSQRLQSGGVALVGDSAHGYHPMAGQGLNVGLVDVAVLVDQMVASLKRYGHFAHEAGLRRFERQRRAQQLAVFELTSALHTLYGASPWWLRLGRNAGLNMLDNLAPIKQFMVQYAHAHLRQLPERYREYAQVLPF